MKYPGKIKEKTKHFPFAPENIKIIADDFGDYKKTIKPDTYTHTKKLICDWSDKKKILVHYSMLIFMLDMEWLLIKFIQLFHLNRVSG